MMRGFWTTLAPMLAAAALVIWGGERLAKREEVSRTAVDRERLHDFSAALRQELDRLDALYQRHLRELAAKAPHIGEKQVSAACQALVGTRECHVFEAGGKRFAAGGRRADPGSPGLPEVELEGRKRPLNPARAVVLPAAWMALEMSGESGVIAAPDGRHEVRWHRSGPTHLVAFTVDLNERRAAEAAHLAEWMESPFAPLQEAGELVAVTGPAGLRLSAPPADARRGPAALLMPHRTSLGEWQVQAWDRLKVTAGHDPATLIGTAGLALVLVLSSGLLFVQQRRALRLAEERVSFVNRVSHELGTPLTNILLNLDLAKSALADRPADARRRLALVNEEVERLGRLVSNVLTFSRRERNRLKLREEPAVPDEVVAGVLAQFQPSLDRRGVEVEWRGGAAAAVQVDRDTLAQVVGNLISNVEKYAASGGWMRLESQLAEGNLVVTVSDRGPGIPADHRERVFEAFTRVNGGVNEGSSGTGLGLSIARDLAQRMGGGLILVPSATGAVFQLTAPAKPHLTVIDFPSVA